MATISSAGIGSNLDVSGIVSQLMAVERQSVTNLDTKEKAFQAKISAFGKIKSALSSLQTAADALSTPAKTGIRKFSVADTSILSGTATSSAAIGTYNIEVKKLALAQKISTAAGQNYSSSTTFETGKLVIDVGTVGGSFANKATIDLTDHNYTLAEIRDKINAAKIDISATIVNTGSEQRLVLSGANTGDAQAFNISITSEGSEVGQSDLAAFAYADGSANYQAISKARNSLIAVDGMDVSRATNTLTDVVDGLTLKLTKESASGVTTAATVSSDSDALTTNIQNFVKAFNDTLKTIRDQSAYNSSTKTAAALNADSSARTIESQMRSVFYSAVSGASQGSSRLSDFGISFQSDGTLAVDSSKLSTAMADPTKSVSQLFADDGTIKGYAAQMSTLVTNLNRYDGIIAGRVDGLNTSVKNIGTQREALELRLEQVQKRYLAQFTSLDTLIGQMSSTSQYLTQQLAQFA